MLFLSAVVADCVNGVSTMGFWAIVTATTNDSVDKVNKVNETICLMKLFSAIVVIDWHSETDITLSAQSTGVSATILFTCSTTATKKEAAIRHPRYCHSHT